VKNDVISTIRAELQQQVDDKTKSTLQRFFKEEVSFYGVKSGAIIKIAQKHFPEVAPLGKNRIFALCEELLKSDYSEEAAIAFDWSYRLHNEYEASDFAVFEKWIRNYVNNWAKCDTLCNHTVAACVEKYPQFISNLKQWTHSENRWFRRAAAVTLIVPAKEGKFLSDVFEISDSLLKDDDDLVQKGYGWMLKSAANKHEKEVFDYVMKNRQAMPRTALRYAIEKMPPDLKRQAMSKS
jgi:3-methyladenine DNA glycosylase AlkD